MKLCNGCGELKELFDFSSNQSSKDKLQNKCRSCKTDANMRYKYGIGMLERAALIVQQNGICPICENNLTEPSLGADQRYLPKVSNNYAVIDHDHAAGKIRGILCGSCNTLLGKAKDDITLLQRAINYLNKNAEVH